MKKYILVLVFTLLVFGDVNANNYVHRTINGYTFKVIKYNTKSNLYNFKIGVNPDYKASDLRSLMEKNNGMSALNGAFFCPADYKECWGQDFTKNERYYKGYKIFTTPTTEDRVVFAVDQEGKPFLYQTDKISANSEKRIYYGIANFPLLLWNGESMFEEYEKLGLIDSKMKAKMPRNFVCHDETKKYIYAGYVSAIELGELPELLKEIGCYNALNLDAGASSSMIYNGRQIIGPGRDILDAVIIEMKGLETQKIHEQVDVMIEKMKTHLSKGYNLQDQLAYIQILSDFINEERTKLYEKNSFNTFDSKGQIDGYEIYLNNVDVATKAYLLNYLNFRLMGLKQDFIDMDGAKRQEQKNAEDRANGLF